MSGKVVITLESRDPLVPSRVSRPLHPDEAVAALGGLGGYVFRVAAGEFAAIYVTREDPLNVSGPCNHPHCRNPEPHVAGTACSVGMP